MKYFFILLSLLLLISCDPITYQPSENDTEEVKDDLSGISSLTNNDSTTDNNTKSQMITGTITFINLEGGFFGIITEDQIKHNPINLDDTLKSDGLNVSYSFEEDTDTFFCHQWGTIITITEIEVKK